MRERTAWCWDKKGVRGDGKESELGLASGLLTQLDLTGKVVTGDALYAQRDLSLRVLGEPPAELESWVYPRACGPRGRGVSPAF